MKNSFVINLYTRSIITNILDISLSLSLSLSLSVHILCPRPPWSKLQASLVFTNVFKFWPFYQTPKFTAPLDDWWKIGRVVWKPAMKL